ISVDAASVTLDGMLANGIRGITAQSLAPTRGGDAGRVAVKAGTLKVINGAVISSTTFGSGNGGTVDVQGQDITLDAGGTGFVTGVIADSQSNGAGGRAGDVSVKADALRMFNGAGVSSNT